MCGVVGHTVDRLGQDTKNLTKKLFDRDAMIRQIEAVYEKLLDA